MSHSKDPSHQQNVLSIATPVSVTVVRKQISLSDVLNLAPGQMIRFDKRCTEDMTLEANGQPIASATAVKVGDQIGVRIR